MGSNRPPERRARSTARLTSANRRGEATNGRPADAFRRLSSLSAAKREKRASKAFSTAHDAGDYQAVIIAYTEAIGLDANYALAFAQARDALHKIGVPFA